MNKGISIAIVIVGALLLAWGVSASGSFTSQVSESVSGAPTNKAIWLIGAGILLGVGGVFGLMQGSKQQ